MAFVLFKNKRQPVEARVKKLSEHQVEIKGCSVNTSGFAYYHDAAMKHRYGDFSAFVTLYRELDESYVLSNDGSVYPETSDSAETPEPTLREVVQEMQNKLISTQTMLGENYNHTARVREEITDIQIALCEIYEMIKGDME